MITSYSSLLVFIGIGIVLPFLVDLVTKRFASGALKSTVLLALSLIAGVLVDLLYALNADVSFDWQAALFGAVTAFVTGVATFFGFAQPVGISGAEGLIQSAVPGGLGSKSEQ